MNVCIRADASREIGIGHLMRCMTLADVLIKQDGRVTFISRELPGNLCDFLENRGYPVARLPMYVSASIASGESDNGKIPTDAEWERDAAETQPVLQNLSPDWLIVDHYGLGAKWERRLRPQVDRIMVIDDLANRSHDCDILLDQNLFDDMLGRYHGLTPLGCRLFLGPRYALLRDEFITARRTLRERDGVIRRILLFFGGSDPTNETEKALLAIQSLERHDLAIDVVVGDANPNGDKIHAICVSMPNVAFHRQIANMAQLMADADLAIGAGGTAMWERCFLGLPALIIVVADNQAKASQAVDNAGLARLVGKSCEVTSAFLATAICEALRKPDALAEMSNHCHSFMGERTAPVDNEILTSLYELTVAR